MKSFSQRKGHKATPDVIQVISISEELRNSLWNVLDIFLWSTDGYVYKQHGKPDIVPFSKRLWFRFFKKPIDTIPSRYESDILKSIRSYFFECAWYEVYDFIEFVVDYYENYQKLIKALNAVLSRELSGFRIISGKVVDITNEQEVQMASALIETDPFVLV